MWTVLAGHSGIPFTRPIGSNSGHNAGVIGMPANDGSQQTWFSLLESAGPGRLRIIHHPLNYDASSAARKMRAAGLTGGYERHWRPDSGQAWMCCPKQKESGQSIDPGRHIWPGQDY